MLKLHNSSEFLVNFFSKKCLSETPNGTIETIEVKDFASKYWIGLIKWSNRFDKPYARWLWKALLYSQNFIVSSSFKKS